jgi:hypothetical protein
MAYDAFANKIVVANYYFLCDLEYCYCANLHDSNLTTCVRFEQVCSKLRECILRPKN